MGGWCVQAYPMLGRERARRRDETHYEARAKPVLIATRSFTGWTDVARRRGATLHAHLRSWSAYSVKGFAVGMMGLLMCRILCFNSTLEISESDVFELER